MPELGSLRDALREALMSCAYDDQYSYQGSTWDQLDKGDKDDYRPEFAPLVSNVMQLVTDFVANWLGDRYGNRSADDLVRLWREDMATEEKE